MRLLPGQARTDVCCDIMRVLRRTPKGTVISSGSPSTTAVGVGQLCIRLLSHSGLRGKGPDGRRDIEASRAAVVAIGDIYPVVVLLLS